jgi:hypothetical protein
MKRLYRHLAVVAVYLLLTLAMTYPLGLRLGTHLLSSKNDFWIYPWNNWWIKKALLEGHNVYYTPYLFYPRGVELFWHGICWFSTFLWLSLQTVLGSLAAHNVAILLTYVVGAYTTYLLAYEVSGSRPAAFVAGLIYAFYPHRFSHRGQLKSLSNQWNPLFALFLVRLTRQGRLRDGLGAGVGLTLSALCSWHQMLLTSVWGAMWVGWSLLAERHRWNRRTLLALVVGGLLCIVLLSPLLVPMVAALMRASEADLLPSASAAKEKSTDLLAYILPNRDHSLFLLGGLGEEYDRYVHLEGPAATVGWVTLLLVGWGALRRWKAVLPWLLAALILAILALGPELQINGRVMSGFPLPYALIEPTIVGDFVRHPNRFNIVLPLPVSVLAAVGLQAILERWKSQRRWTYGVTFCLALSILFEYSVAPVPTTRPPDSVFYQRLREEVGEFAVADFPIDLSEDKYYLFTQTLHERPIVGGHVSRPPADAHAFIESVPVLAAAREGPPTQDGLADVSRQLEPLAKAGVRYVMVHKDRAEAGEVEGWRRWFGFRPAYEDDLVLAYRTEPVYGREFELAQELYAGLGLVQATVSVDMERAPVLVEVSVLWGAAEPQHEDWLAELALVDEAGRHIQTATFPLVDGWPTGEWPADALGRGRYGLQVDPQLPDGSYELTLALVRADTGERVEESVVTIAALDMPWRLHTLVLPPVRIETETAFGVVLSLLGYDMRQEDDALTVTLHWQALRRMGESYKVFLHLYDVESGALVAQVDVVPRDWTYPTTSWVVGEVVSDELHLPLGEIPAGTYRLGAGAYDADTGERLPVRGTEASSDVLILREMALP